MVEAPVLEINTLIKKLFWYLLTAKDGRPALC